MCSISDRIGQYCCANKILYTVRRKEVVIVLELAGGFTGAENLWMMILKRKKVKISLSSVYNVLNWLVKIGFAERDNGKGSYGMFRLLNKAYQQSGFTSGE